MTNDSSLSTVVVVRNPQGLHARPADMLVRLANQFDSTIKIGKGSEHVDCKSILSLLTLGAAAGTELSISAFGSDADAAIQAIVELFEAGFHEMNDEE
ncbi:Phosphocarrier protein HPr [Novipirellula aureliae]|uniref:Phosphocarrier protein HPr n=1 Tax=Novipirellula aureliae TaxID=2527966 RepID=A0A5C6DEC8_9BACT|nr:HPr family phosphocarrier protein [Novipirellula aureliae]TWU34555.1 Phosphocarrier protein HPr [Novipirellula aureliae]